MTGPDDPAARLAALVAASPAHMDLLARVAALNLADGWIAAGFVRDVVWNHLHDLPAALPRGDVDVVWHDPDPAMADPAIDTALEARLRRGRPDIDWSVKNQARMHLRNNAAPYLSTADAMSRWPETATATAVRLAADGRIEVLAPLGLDDLFAMIIRPTPHFHDTGQIPVMMGRVRDKDWLARWPRLRLVV